MLVCGSKHKNLLESKMYRTIILSYNNMVAPNLIQKILYAFVPWLLLRFEINIFHNKRQYFLFVLMMQTKKLVLLSCCKTEGNTLVMKVCGYLSLLVIVDSCLLATTCLVCDFINFLNL